MAIVALALALYRRSKPSNSPRLSIGYAGATNSLAPGPTEFCIGFWATNADSHPIGFEFDSVEWETTRGLQRFNFSSAGWHTGGRRWTPGHQAMAYLFLPPELATNGVPWRAHINCWYEAEGLWAWFDGVIGGVKRDVNRHRSKSLPTVSIVISNLPPPAFENH